MTIWVSRCRATTLSSLQRVQRVDAGRSAVTGDATIALRRLPTPSIQLTRTSPGRRNCGGVRAAPIPAGVPVKIRSPGSSGQTADRPAISSGTGKIKVL